MRERNVKKIQVQWVHLVGAISEAVEDAATHNDAKYSLGSVLNHAFTSDSNWS